MFDDEDFIFKFFRLVLVSLIFLDYCCWGSYS